MWSARIFSPSTTASCSGNYEADGG